MLRSLSVITVFTCATALQAAQCLPDTLQNYLSASPCTIGAVTFANFDLAPSLPSTTTVFDPMFVNVTPGGTEFAPTVTFALNGMPLSFESLGLFFRFQAAGPMLNGYALSLNGASATDPAAVIGILDVCPDGMFAGPGPVSCPTTAEALVVVNTESFPQTSDSRTGSFASFFDIFTELTLDEGNGGEAQLTSATIAINAVPEPATALLIPAAFGLLALLRRRTRALPAILACSILPLTMQAANHREAPITALDHKADITDVFAFRSYDGGATPRVTMILCVDPLLDPANGPNWFPFDKDILYEIKVDNNNDAVEDIVFQIRFQTEQRLPGLFTVYAGILGGKNSPLNSPAPVPIGTPIVPDKITNFNSPGLGQRQSYTVTMIKGGVATPITGPTPFYAVPANVGPRTMDYAALFNAAINTTNMTNVKVFAGTVDDPFWIDLGGAFDTLNTSLQPPVLSQAQDDASQNLSADTVSGYAVNTIAIEVPVSLLTKNGTVEPAASTSATIGVWGATSRMRITTRRAPLPAINSGSWSQIQRMGNPLINELIIGTGSKDKFSMDQPKNDSQFANFFLDPALARILNALTDGAVAVPDAPRNDLLPLVTYAAPIAAPGTTAGPIADLLRLNTGVAPTPEASIKRLGLLGGDPAGFPNGRRLQDDVTDIALRVVAGVLAGAPFSTSPLNSKLGDGVNVNDAPYTPTFPYVGHSPSGRNRRHVDPGETLCTPLFGGGPPCLP